MDKTMKYAVLLHGCGVYDGTEIHEAVCTLLAIAQAGHEYQCIAPDVPQHHVLNHTTGTEMPESRNVFVESARIARGDIKRVNEIDVADYDGLVMPGGFGTAKNITTWAFNGPAGEIEPHTKKLILDFAEARKPIAALCMSPTTLAKAFEGTQFMAHLSVGTTQEPSPYDINAISEGMESLGAVAEMKTVREVAVDETLKIVTAPCYMMEANIVDVYENTRQAIAELIRMS
jgi:enhancing lycopene biosynthesis protein 2